MPCIATCDLLHTSSSFAGNIHAMATWHLKSHRSIWGLTGTADGFSGISVVIRSLENLSIARYIFFKTSILLHIVIMQHPVAHHLLVHVIDTPSRTTETCSYLYISNISSYDLTLRRGIKTHIIRYHTRNRMQTPQIKFFIVVSFLKSFSIALHSSVHMAIINCFTFAEWKMLYMVKVLFLVLSHLCASISHSDGPLSLWIACILLWLQYGSIAASASLPRGKEHPVHTG
jgi:hypothetical protein